MSRKASKKMTADKYVARFEAEQAVMERAYCNIFKFWRACPFKPCRKARACAGDQHACLKRGENDIPRRVQWQARRQLIAATPASAGAPERNARECMPKAFYELQAQRERNFSSLPAHGKSEPIS